MHSALKVNRISTLYMSNRCSGVKIGPQTKRVEGGVVGKVELSCILAQCQGELIFPASQMTQLASMRSGRVVTKNSRG